MRLDVRRLDTINWVRGDRTNSSDMQWQVASGFTDWTRATWDGVLRISCDRTRAHITDPVYAQALRPGGVCLGSPMIIPGRE